MTVICGGCGAELENAAAKHTIIDCGYEWRHRAAQAEAALAAERERAERWEWVARQIPRNHLRDADSYLSMYLSRYDAAHPAPEPTDG